MRHDHHKQRKSASPGIVIAVSMIFLLFGLYNLFIVVAANSAVDNNIAQANELARPGKLDITEIDFACDSCFKASALIEDIKSLDVNVTSVRAIDYRSDEAKSLMQRYGITRLPSIIVTGEINKSSRFQSKMQDFGARVNDAMVVNNQPPPYYDMSQGRVVGIIKAIELVDSSCTSCSSTSALVASLKQSGLVFDQRKVDISSYEGNALARKYNITKVPSLILDSDARYYQGFETAWSSLGTREQDAYVLRSISPPYMDLSTGKERGIVDLILVNDTTCKDCYDVNVHRTILPRFGITPASTRVVDINSDEGIALKQRYNITAVPTFITSSGAADYPQLVSIWPKVGTVEKDGSFVFRSMKALGSIAYRNTATGEVINK